MRIYNLTLGLVATMGLAGCGGLDLDFGMVNKRAAPEKVSVADVVVAGPPGYCVDPDASKMEGQDGAFVLLGSCASIAQDAEQPSPAAPGVLTVTVSSNATDGAAIAESLEQFAAFFETDEGRATLSRTGQADTVSVEDIRIEDGVLLIQATDTSPVVDGIAPDVWRALFGVNDRLLSASVNGFAAQPLSKEAGFIMLDALMRRILAENRAAQAG
ncbi:MAG: hypothetical protein AAGA87_02195 [Pseudomonadota bacterium]